MLRFLVVAFPLVLFELAVFAFAADVLRLGPPMASPLPSAGADAALSTPAILGGWVLEATALVGLFLLVLGRTSSRWLDGLMAAWSAWIFRGPLTLLGLAAVLGPAAGGGRWGSGVAGWILYSVVGLSLAGLAGFDGRRRKPARVAVAADTAAAQPPAQARPDLAVVESPPPD